VKLKVKALQIGLYLCVSCSLVYASDVHAPSAEFWQYLLEFSDENGEVIDPMEFAQLQNMSAASQQQLTQNRNSSSSNPRSSSAAEEPLQ
jgi:hypothetical protein